MDFKTLRRGLQLAAGICHGRRAFGPPLQVNVSITRRCNLRCRHCFIHSPLASRRTVGCGRSSFRCGGTAAAESKGGKERHEADVDWVREAVSQFRALGTRRFQFSGSGELFTHPQALEILEFAKSTGAYVVVNTNGQLLNPQTVERLIAMGLDELRVTVMAGSPDLYRFLHGSTEDDTFQNLNANLGYLQQRKGELGSVRPKLNIVTVLVSENCGDLHSFVNYMCLLRPQAVTFKAFDSFAQPGLLALVPSSEQTVQTSKRLAQSKRLLSAHGIENNIDEFMLTFFGELDASHLYRRIPCYYGWLAASIEFDGNVYFCSRAEQPLGNINRTPFPEIWGSAEYEERRAEARQTSGGPKKDSCSGCPHCFANLRTHRILHPWQRLKPVVRDVQNDNDRKRDAENDY